MKIKKFFESSQIDDISKERVDEIIIELTSLMTEFNNSREDLVSFSSELGRYRSKSSKTNDQIDDSSITLDDVVSKLDSIISSVDVVISNLNDYNSNGRKYLYGSD